jgi:hypothetical protein
MSEATRLPFFFGHPERSTVFCEAKHRAESKDPYTSNFISSVTRCSLCAGRTPRSDSYDINGVGVLRLRKSARVACGHTALRMTECLDYF